ncbi:MAG: hypothetical protein H6558_19890 [Lewinellaceae bacterium]|nr:hypothetical protein [Lewinellaceae bacterium]MCB9290345.1 hypothetical protein [Lewinellaceae bacterium]
MFKLGFHIVILRYYLMMLVTIIAVTTHQMWLVPVIMAIAISAILGYRFGGTEEKGKVVRMEASPEETIRKAG